MKTLPSVLAFGLLLLLGCQNNRAEKDAFTPSNDSTSIGGSGPDSVKLVKTAGLDFKVKNVTQSTRAVADLARQFGGAIYSQRLESTEEGRKELRLSSDSLLLVTAYAPHAAITVRVPAPQLEAFIFGVADLGYFTGSSQLQIDDKSFAYLRNALKQKVRTDVVAPLSTITNKSANSLQSIEVRDEAIEQKIANKIIDADVAYSTVNLTLFQNPLVLKETVADYHIAAYDLSFAQRLRNALDSGWQAFLSFVLALAHLWLFIVVGIAVFLSYRRLNKRRWADSSFKP